MIPSRAGFRYSIPRTRPRQSRKCPRRSAFLFLVWVPSVRRSVVPSGPRTTRRIGLACGVCSVPLLGSTSATRANAEGVAAAGVTAGIVSCGCGPRCTWQFQSSNVDRGIPVSRQNALSLRPLSRKASREAAFSSALQRRRRERPSESDDRRANVPGAREMTCISERLRKRKDGSVHRAMMRFLIMKL
jgi:hypothetical protein